VWRYLLFDRLLTEQNIAMQKIGLHIMPLRDQENRWVNFSVLSFTWFTPDGTPIGIKYRFSDANWNNPRYHKTVIRSRYTQEAGGAIHGAVYIAPCVRNSPEDNAEIYRLPLLGAEGEFKAITFAQLGFDAFTCGAATGAPRTHIPSQWDVYFRGRSRAIYIHDNDDAGRTAAQQIVNIMPIPTKTISVPAPYKAFDDWLLVPPPPSQRGPHDAILWLESKVFPLI
jgi:hypothetical protein